MMRLLPTVLCLLGLFAGCTRADTSPTPTPPAATTLSGTVIAPAGGNVFGTVVMACIPLGDDCDETKSRYVDISEVGLSANFLIAGLDKVTYLLFAVKDTNDNGEFGDEGDYLGFYGPNGDVTAPAENLQIQMSVVPGGTTPYPAPEPYSVSGTARDWQGNPIPNARIWIEPALTMGLVEVRTDVQGRYQVTNLPSIPYYASAYTQVAYNGQNFCLRLGMGKDSDYDAFTPDAGVIRNFQLQLTGPIIDRPDHFFGGTFRVYKFGMYAGLGKAIEFTFTATGPRIDGSAGESFSRTVVLGSPDHLELKDIPVGPYLVEATLIGFDDNHTALKMGPDIFEAHFEQIRMDWSPVGDCYKINDIDVNFVWLANPGE